MKVIFFGTPKFSVEVLKAIKASSHIIVGVITNPDQTGKRGKQLIESPVKEYAKNNNLPIFQFENINLNSETIISLGADIGVTAAYGQILKNHTIDLFKHGIINVHASLLPKYRGASPVQCAILNGEKEIGVTIMKTVLEVDAGDILNCEKITLKGDENALECLEMLAPIGGLALVRTLNEIERGILRPIPQKNDEASFCKKIEKEDGFTDFSEPAQLIFNKIRAYHPWPSLYCITKYGTLKIIKAEIACFDYVPTTNGKIMDTSKGKFVVSCKEGFINIKELQLEGSKIMPSKDFLLGHPFVVGDSLIINEKM